MRTVQKTLGFSDGVSFLRSLPAAMRRLALAASLPGERRFDAGFASCVPVDGRRARRNGSVWG